MGDLQLRVVDISIRIRQLEELNYAIKSKSFVVGSYVFELKDTTKLEAKVNELKVDLIGKLNYLLSYLQQNK